MATAIRTLLRPAGGKPVLDTVLVKFGGLIRGLNIEVTAVFRMCQCAEVQKMALVWEGKHRSRTSLTYKHDGIRERNHWIAVGDEWRWHEGGTQSGRFRVS